MPQAQPRAVPVPPATLNADDVANIKRVVGLYYGVDAVIRSWGPDPRRLFLHVEAAIDPGVERWECLGSLMCEIVRDEIILDVVKRGTRVRGNSKLAYRQGQVI